MDTKALMKIGYGMYVIGSRKGDKLNAQIANTVFQITSEPPTIAVSINKKNLTHEYIRESRYFSASILCQGAPLEFIGKFGFKSGRDTDKLSGVGYKKGSTGVPIITDYAVSCLEARVVNEVDVGTHTIFIGEVLGSEVLTEEACMTYDYYHEIKRGTTPSTAPTYSKKKQGGEMAKYEFSVCGYVYDPQSGDPDSGVKPGTAFEDLPDGWVCPVCGAPKSQFKKLG